MKTTADVNLRSIENAADAMDMNALTEEQNQQIQMELSGVLGNLMNYVATLQVAA